MEVHQGHCDQVKIQTVYWGHLDQGDPYLNVFILQMQYNRNTTQIQIVYWGHLDQGDPYLNVFILPPICISWTESSITQPTYPIFLFHQAG